MKIQLYLISIALLQISCAKHKTNILNLPAGHPKAPLTVRIVERNADADSVSQRRAGPQPLLLGPEALRDVYVAVFGTSPRRNINEPGFFTLTERDELGGFRLIKPANPDGAQMPSDPSTIRLSKLSSDYLFTLRKFAAGACAKLVASEIDSPKNTNNKLVESEMPSVAKINSFLSLLLGYNSKNGIHIGAQEYKTAFERMFNSAPEPGTSVEKTERLKASYVHLCVALSTDARIYIR